MIEIDGKRELVFQWVKQVGVGESQFSFGNKLVNA